MAFKETLALILSWEGVYDNDSADSGGETVFGITRVYEPTWKGWPIVDGMFPVANRVDNDFIKAWATDNLPKNPALMAQVEAYYLAVFEKICLNDCDSDKLDSCIMGGYVNQGPRVERWLQETISELGVPVLVDGKLGPSTMQALDAVLKWPYGETVLLNGLMLRRCRAYSKSKPKFVAGLLNRLFAGG